MTARPATLVLLLLAGAPAQEVVFIGPTLEALWKGDDGRVRVQSGRRVYAFEGNGRGGLRRVASSGGPGPAFTWVAEGVELFDLGRTSLFIGRRGVAGDAWKGPETALTSLLRRPVAGPPLRLPLLKSGVVLVPARGGWGVHRPGPAGAGKLAVTLGGRADLGWGVGDDMVVTSIAPHVVVRRRGRGRPPDILVGRDGVYHLHRAGEDAPRPLKPAVFDDEEGLLEFPYAIPPCVADLDGDGDDELLVCDPSAGCAFLYLDLDAAVPEVSRLIRLAGLLLRAWVEDLDRDGRCDLVLLKLPPLGLRARIAILQKERTRAEALFYPGRRDGFPPSPTLRVSLEIPLEITVTNELREARMPALVSPVPGPALLVGRPGAALELVPFGKGEARRSLGVLPRGRALDPFETVPLPRSRRAFGWVAPGEGRVLLVDADVR